MRRILMLFFGICLACPPGYGKDVIVTNREFSFGFKDGGLIYFLIDTEILRKGDTVWFIAPIQLPSTVLYRRIHLYCASREQPGTLHKLAEVRSRFAAPASVKYSLFAKDGSNIAFAYLYGKKSFARRSALDMYTWDTAEGSLSPVAEKMKETFYRDHFQDYRIPLDRNPEFISFAEIRRMIHEDTAIPVPED